MSEGKPKPHVTVLIPTYKEARFIRHTLERVGRQLDAAGVFDHEIIVLDDHSCDGTVEEALKYSETCDGRVRVAEFSERMGKGGSLRNGLRLARGEIIVFLDADLPVEVGRIVELIKMAERGFGLVVARRVYAEGGSYGLSRRVLSVCFNALVRALFRTGITDHQVGFKAVSAGVAKKLVDQIRTDGYFFDAEFIVQVKRMNVPIKVLDVPWKDKRPPGDSKIPPMRALVTMLADLLALRVSYIHGKRLIPLASEEAGYLTEHTNGKVQIRATRMHFSLKRKRLLNLLSKIYFAILFGKK